MPDLELWDQTVLTLAQWTATGRGYGASGFFEPVDLRATVASAASDQPITRAMIDSAATRQQIQTPYIHGIYAAVGRSLAPRGFEVSSPSSFRTAVIHGELIAAEPGVASVLVGVELEPVLSAYADVESVDPVIFFYPPEN